MISLDGLLRGLNPVRLTVNHPEYGSNGVYSALKKHIVLLDAEPQIGKTGAILSILEILDNVFIKDQRVRICSVCETNDHAIDDCPEVQQLRIHKTKN